MRNPILILATLPLSTDTIVKTPEAVTSSAAGVSVVELFQVGGNVAIVLTLFFLAWQTRLSQKATKSLCAQTSSSGFNTFYLTLASDGTLAELYRRGRKDPSTLDEIETHRFFYACVIWFTNHESTYMQWKKKLLPKDFFAAWDVALRDDLVDIGFREFWNIEGEFFDRKFRDYINAIFRRIEMVTIHEPSAQPKSP